LINALTIALDWGASVAPTETRKPERTLLARGHRFRGISRVPVMSRDTVRRNLRASGGDVAETPPGEGATLCRLKAAFVHARCNVVRARELLMDGDLRVSHRTWTRWQGRQSCAGRRAGEHDFQPGQGCSTTPCGTR